jgi:hypothetical protein
VAAAAAVLLLLLLLLLLLSRVPKKAPTLAQSMEPLVTWRQGIEQTYI